MTYSYDRTKTATMDLNKLSDVLGNVWSTLIYVQGQVTSRKDTISGRLYHLNTDASRAATEAEKLVHGVLDWVEAHRAEFGPEVEQKVLNPLAQALMFCKQVPYLLEGGVGHVNADMKFLAEDTDRVVGRVKEGGDAVRVLWDLANKG